MVRALHNVGGVKISKRVTIGNGTKNDFQGNWVLPVFLKLSLLLHGSSAEYGSLQVHCFIVVTAM